MLMLAFSDAKKKSARNDKQTSDRNAKETAVLDEACRIDVRRSLMLALTLVQKWESRSTFFI